MQQRFIIKRKLDLSDENVTNISTPKVNKTATTSVSKTEKIKAPQMNISPRFIKEEKKDKQKQQKKEKPVKFVQQKLKVDPSSKNLSLSEPEVEPLIDVDHTILT